MFPSKLGAIVVDVFGLLTLATVIFGDPGVGLATGTFSGFDDIDYLSKIVPEVDNEQTFPSFGADPVGQRTRRVADYHNLGGYPLPEYEPVEPKHVSNAWSQMNPSITHYIDQPVQSGHPSQENVDFFHNFARYYGNLDQQHGDGYEVLDPKVYGIEDEYIPGEGNEDGKEGELSEGGHASNQGLSESVESEEDSESMEDEEPRDEHEEGPTHPENLYLIEQQLQDLIHQISSLYTLVHRNPYLAPVLTPYLHSNLPLSAYLYSPPQAAPVPLGKQLINFSHGPLPANYPMHPVNYPAWPSNFPAGLANYPVGSANYPIGSANYPTGLANYPTGLANYPAGSANYPTGSAKYPASPVRLGNYPGSPVNYQVPPINYHGSSVNYPVRPVHYPAKPVIMPQQQTIPLQVRFH